MVERAHTPGPWLISSITETAVENASGRGICSTGGYQQNFDTERVYRENIANARLIAAAPDMFEALCLAHDYLAANGWEGDERMRPILAAIAKAQGLGQSADATPKPLHGESAP